MSSGGYAASLAPVRTQTLFGRVMALVAITVAFATLGAYLGRNLGGADWFIAWLLAIGCLVGLNVANARGHEGPALALLFGFGLLMGVSIATTINYYSTTDPTAVRQALGATTLFVGGLGAGGYATRRDLSFLYRTAFWLLVLLIIGGIVLIFVHIPALYTVYAIAGLGIFGLYTVIDFNRLRRAGSNEAIPLAAGIFLDVLNIFLLFLRLFARSS
jgi:FtsH-binding integral membrane protein